MPRAIGWRIDPVQSAGIFTGKPFREWHYNGSSWVDLSAAESNIVPYFSLDPSVSPISGDKGFGFATGSKALDHVVLKMSHGPIDYGSAASGDQVQPRYSTALIGTHTDDYLFIAYRIMKSGTTAMADTMYYGAISGSDYEWNGLLIGSNLGWSRTGGIDFRGGIAPTGLGTEDSNSASPGYNKHNGFGGNPVVANTILANIDDADMIVQMEHTANMANDGIAGVLETVVLDFTDYVVSTKPAAADFKEDFETASRFVLEHFDTPVRGASYAKNGSFGLSMDTVKRSLRTGSMATACDRSVSITPHATADSAKFGAWVYPEDQGVECGLAIATGLPDDFLRIGIRARVTGQADGKFGVWDSEGETLTLSNFINDANWYWVEGEWTALNTVTMRVFDSSGSQIVGDVTHTVNAASPFLDSGHWMCPGLWINSTTPNNTVSARFDDVSFGRDDNPFGPAVTDLRLADNEVTAVKLGDTNVTAVYLGDTQVF